MGLFHLFITLNCLMIIYPDDGIGTCVYLLVVLAPGVRVVPAVQLVLVSPVTQQSTVRTQP